MNRVVAAILIAAVVVVAVLVAPDELVGIAFVRFVEWAVERLIFKRSRPPGAGFWTAARVT